jgi:hypothetical protein
MIIENRNFILSGLNAPSKFVIETHGKYWKVIEEKSIIPRLSSPGYLLKSLQDNHFIVMKRNNSGQFKVESEYFTESKLILNEVEA